MNPLWALVFFTFVQVDPIADQLKEAPVAHLYQSKELCESSGKEATRKVGKSDYACVPVDTPMVASISKAVPVCKGP